MLPIDELILGTIDTGLMYYMVNYALDWHMCINGGGT